MNRSTTVFALIDRPGTYGTYALVHEVHDDLRSADRHARAKRLTVITAGEGTTFQPGERVHRKDTTRYSALADALRAEMERRP